MSQVDERTLKLGMDYSELESGAEKSISIIDKFKEALNFKDTESSMNSVATSFANTTTSMESTTQESTSKIASFFEECWSNIKTGFEREIGANLSNQLNSLVDSLTTAPISSGWDKYKTNVESVQKILTNSTYSIEEVETKIDELAWYSDQTSYGLTDMTGALSTFIAAGNDMDTSVDNIMGIANWCATAGVNASTASGAFDMLSKAVSAGYVSTLQWNSLSKVYHMGTTTFFDTVEEAAIAAGSIKKNADGTYEAMKDTGEWTDESFESMSALMQNTLKYKWFDSDIMDAVFNKFGSASKEIYEWMEETGADTEDVEAAVEELGLTTEDFGLKAFYAAQRAKTWSDVVDAWRDVVSTSWGTTFQALFGNYEEASEFWTWFVDDVGDFFWTLPSAIAEAATEWHSLNTSEFGSSNQTVTRYEQFIWTIKNIVSGIRALGGYFADWFTESFGVFGSSDFAKITSNMWAWSRRFYDFATGTNLSGDSLKYWYRLKAFFEGIGDAIELIVGLFKTLGEVIEYFFSGGETWEDAYGFERSETFGRFSESLDDATGFLYAFGDALTTIKESADKWDFLENLKEHLESIVDFLWKIGSTVGKGILSLLGIDDTGIVDSEHNSFVSGLDTIEEKIDAFFEYLDNAPTLEEWVNEHLSSWMDSSSTLGSTFGDWLYKSGDYDFVGVEEAIGQDGGNYLNAILEAYGVETSDLSGYIDNAAFEALLQQRDDFLEYVADMFGVEADYETVMSMFQEQLQKSNQLSGEKFLKKGSGKRDTAWSEIFATQLEEAALGMDDGYVIEPIDLLMARITTYIQSLPSIWEIIMNVGQGYLDGSGISEHADNFVSFFIDKITEGFDKIKGDTTFTSIMDSIWDLFGSEYDSEDYEQSWYNLGYGIGQVAQSIGEFIDVSWSTFTEAVESFKTGLKGIWEAIKDYLPDEWVSKIEDFFGYGGDGKKNNKVSGFIEDVTQMVEDFGEAFGLFVSAFTHAITGDSEGLEDDYKKAEELFGSIGKLIPLFGQIMDAALGFLGPLIEFLTGTFQDWMNEIDEVSNGDETWFEGAMDSFTSLFDNLGNFFTELWGTIKNFWVNSGLSSENNGDISATADQVGLVCSAYSSVSSTMAPYVTTLSTSVDAGGISTGTSSTMTAMEALATAWTNIKMYAGAAGGMAKQTVVGVVTLICETVGDCLVVIITQLGRVYDAFTDSGLMQAVISGTVIWGIITAVTAFKYMCKAIQTMASSFTICFSGFSAIGAGVKNMGRAQLIEAYTDGIKDIVVALVLMVAACAALSFIPTDQLYAGAGALFALSIALAILFAAYAYFVNITTTAKANAAATTEAAKLKTTASVTLGKFSASLEGISSALMNSFGSFLTYKGKAEYMQAQAKLVVAVVIAIAAVILIIVGLALGLQAMLSHGYQNALIIAAAAVVVVGVLIFAFLKGISTAIGKITMGNWKKSFGQAAVITALAVLLSTVVVVIVVLIGVILAASLAIREIIMGPNGVDAYGIAGLAIALALVLGLLYALYKFIASINKIALKGVGEKTASAKLKVLLGMAAVLFAVAAVLVVVIAAIVVIGLLVAADMSSFVVSAIIVAAILGILIGLIAVIGHVCKSGTTIRASYLKQLTITILAVAAFLIAIAVAMLIVSKCDWENIDLGKFIGVMAFMVLLPSLLVAVGSFALSKHLINDSSLKSMALIIVGIAAFALILAAAMAIIASIDWDGIDTDKLFGMMIILAALPALLAVLAGVVAIALPGLGDLALAAIGILLLGFAAAVIAVGAGLYLLAKALNTVANIDTNGLNANLDAIGDHIFSVGASVGLAILAIGKYGKEGLDMIMPLLQPIIDFIEKIFVAIIVVAAILAAVFATCGEDIGDFVDNFVNAFKDLISGVRDILPDIGGLLSDLIGTMLQVVTDAAPYLEEAISALVKAVLRGILLGLDIVGITEKVAEWLGEDSEVHEVQIKYQMTDQKGNPISDSYGYKNMYFDDEESWESFQKYHPEYTYGVDLITIDGSNAEFQANQLANSHTLEKAEEAGAADGTTVAESYAESWSEKIETGITDTADEVLEGAENGVEHLKDGATDLYNKYLGEDGVVANALSGDDDSGSSSGSSGGFLSKIMGHLGFGDYVNSDGSLNTEKIAADSGLDKLTSGDSSFLSLIGQSLGVSDGEEVDVFTAINAVSNGETITLSDGTTFTSMDDVTTYASDYLGYDLTELTTNFSMSINDDGTVTYNGTTYASQQEALEAMTADWSTSGEETDSSVEVPTEVNYNVTTGTVDSDIETLYSYVDTMEDVGTALGNALVTGLQSAWASSKGAGVWCGIKFSTGARSKYSLLKSAGQYLGQGLIDGIKAKYDALWQVGYTAGSKVEAGLRAQGLIKSPSRAWYQDALYMIAGVVNAFSDNETTLYNAGYSVGSNIEAGFQDTMTTSAWSVSPVFDTTNLQNGAANISSMFQNASGLNAQYTADIRGSGISTKALVTQGFSDLNGSFGKMLSSSDGLGEKFDHLETAIKNMDVTLDSDRVVGGITNKMDKSLAKSYERRRRG